MGLVANESVAGMYLIMLCVSKSRYVFSGVIEYVKLNVKDL